MNKNSNFDAFEKVAMGRTKRVWRNMSSFQIAGAERKTSGHAISMFTGTKHSVFEIKIEADYIY